MQSFDNPALRIHKTIWSLASVPDLKDFVYVIENEEHKTLICDILDAFSREVVPLYGNFRQGVYMLCKLWQFNNIQACDFSELN